jgi:hypothetical protein
MEDIDVIAEYGGKDGKRDWVSAGAWLLPGDVIAVMSLQDVAELKRWVATVAHAVSELEDVDDETAQSQAAALRELLRANTQGKRGQPAPEE